MRKSSLVLFVLTFSLLFTTMCFASQHIGTDARGTTITGITATGSGTDYTATATYNSEFSIADPNRTGYTFDGWTVLGTDASVTTLVGKTKTDGKFTNVKGLTNIKNLSAVQNNNVTVRAAWTPITYNLTYNLDGGSLSGQKTSYTIETDSFSLPTPTKSNYTFTGWTGSNGTTPQTTVTIPKGSMGDKAYTANWEAPLVDLTFTYVYDSWWGNIKYGTTNEQATAKTYKVPAGSLVKLYGKMGSRQLYLYNNGGSFKWEPTGQTANGYITSPSTVTGIQFNMPSSALSLRLGSRGGSNSNYDVRVYSGSVVLNALEE